MTHDPNWSNKNADGLVDSTMWVRKPDVTQACDEANLRQRMTGRSLIDSTPFTSTSFVSANLMNTIRSGITGALSGMAPNYTRESMSPTSFNWLWPETDADAGKTIVSTTSPPTGSVSFWTKLNNGTTWTDTIASGVAVRAVHTNEIRSGLKMLRKARVVFPVFFWAGIGHGDNPLSDSLRYTNCPGMPRNGEFGYYTDPVIRPCNWACLYSQYGTNYDLRAIGKWEHPFAGCSGLFTVLPSSFITINSTRARTIDLRNLKKDITVTARRQSDYYYGPSAPYPMTGYTGTNEFTVTWNDEQPPCWTCSRLQQATKTFNSGYYQSHDFVGDLWETPGATGPTDSDLICSATYAVNTSQTFTGDTVTNMLQQIINGTAKPYFMLSTSTVNSNPAVLTMTITLDFELV